MEDKERYAHGHSSPATQIMGLRTVQTHAAFLVPYLRSGMTLLDCGCGPGSITIGLAETVAPGSVIGIDIAENQIQQAVASAAESGVTNVHFQQGNCYDLEFPDDHFDAVFVHSVIEHVNDQSKALGEMKRVLKRGGVIGVREAIWDGTVMRPEYESITKGWELLRRHVDHNGGDTDTGRKLRSILSQAGFVRVEATSSCSSHGAGAVVAALFQEFFASAPPTQRMIELGWTTREELNAVADAWQQWGQHPQAFTAGSWCEAVGWKE